MTGKRWKGEMKCSVNHGLESNSPCSGNTTASITPPEQDTHPEDKELLLQVVCLGVSEPHQLDSSD